MLVLNIPKSGFCYMNLTFKSTFTWEAKLTQTGMRFHFGWKSHFGVQSALYLCSHELRRNKTQTGMDFISVIWTEMKFQTGMRFLCEQNLPEAKRISVNSLDIAFNEHVRLKLIGIILTEMKFAYACPSKYQVILKCSRNETSCEQNLFSRWFEISNGHEFISRLFCT